MRGRDLDREGVLVLLTDRLPKGVPLDPDRGTMEGTVLRAAEAEAVAGIYEEIALRLACR